MNDAGTLYSRSEERTGRLPMSTKFYQALGAIPDSFKTWAFNTFLLLYYNQVLGLPATWVSFVLTISIVIDAVTDPMVGSLSDGLRTRLGRRHPLMYAAILPLGICLFCVFSPPANLSEMSLIAWLAIFAILSRVAMTFFLIPWSALFPELTDDYAERSEVIMWRYLVGGIATVIFSILVWSLVFPSDETFKSGQLNPDGYPVFAVVLSTSVMVFAFLTTWLTQREVKYLRQPQMQQTFGIVGTLRDLRGSLENPHFRLLFTGLLIASTVSGTLAALEIYLHTYFWGLTPENLRWFAMAGIGAIIAFAIIPMLQKRFDKKDLLLWCMVSNLVIALSMISLRFLEILPDNGDPLLLVLLVTVGGVHAFFGVIVGVMFVSMIADTMDAQDLRTGKRQEGVFSAAISFSNKAVSGFGILAAGVLLDNFVRFPKNAAPEAVSPDVLVRLGLTVIVVCLFYFIPFYMTTRYQISRQAHASIIEALALRRSAAQREEI